MHLGEQKCHVPKLGDLDLVERSYSPLLFFVFLFCPEHNSNTYAARLMKHHTLVEGNDRKCSAQEP